MDVQRSGFVMGTELLRLLRRAKNCFIINSPLVFRQSNSWLRFIFIKQYNKYNNAIEPSKSFKSNLPIDVIIPVIEKDLDVLPSVVAGITQHIKHPIKNIYIVSPISKKTMGLAEKMGCTFVNEQDVCNISLQEIDVVFEGKNRSGWIYQQLLKLNFDKVATQAQYLVVDADTVFVKDTVFEHNGKLYFDFADEYHLPYYKAYTLLTGMKHSMQVSFVSHYMLFEKAMLQKLRAKIEKNTGKPVSAAIINMKNSIQDQSYFSEYETYANFCISVSSRKYRLRYWFNKSCQINELTNLPQIASNGQWRSISFHAYNN